MTIKTKTNKQKKNGVLCSNPQKKTLCNKLFKMENIYVIYAMQAKLFLYKRTKCVSNGDRTQY